MITKKEVQHVAKLARLGITRKEEEKFARELSLILDYIEKLKEVDVSGVEPTSHSILIENVTREDIEKSKISIRAVGSTSQIGKNQKSKRLLELAPETKEGYLKTKSIL